VSESSRNSPRDKLVTRRAVLSLRDALPVDARVAASAKIGERAVGELGARLEPGRIVALYAAKGSVVDTAALDRALRAAAIRVVYPRVLDGQRELAFYEIAPEELEPSRFGLREPRLAGTSIAPAAIDAFCVPGLAFDRDGWRVGWGHGHYDATLSLAPSALRVGLAFERQLVAAVAHDSHDARMHVVVTETDSYKARA
jgi:5-formyltetrahydrofolate cyclo-ligase